MFFKAKDMLRKAKRKNYPTILSRWKAEQSYRSSLEENDIGEKEIILYGSKCFGERRPYSYESWNEYDILRSGVSR